MQKQQYVTIATVSEKEYLIKDKFGITIGRIFIMEINKENRYSIFRMKMYKERDNYKEYRNALELMIMSLFKKMNIQKINVIVNENLNERAFIDLGFILEGIMFNNRLVDDCYENEFLFGIDEKTFDNNSRINVLRLKGNRIELKILTPEDTEYMLDYYLRNREFLQPFEPAREEKFFTLEGQKQNLMESYKSFLNGSNLNFGIYLNKKLIGKIQITNIVLGVFKNCFVGYSIDQKEQGKGYMKEALNLVIEYVFNDLELHRIEASTLVDNFRSQFVLKACDFKEIGISEKYLFINGKWRDHKIFYKVNENY